MEQIIKLVVSDVDGTLTDGGIYIDSNGVQSKKFNAKDGIGFKLLQQQGIKTALLSASHNDTIVHARAKMLNIDLVYVGFENKLEILKGWAKELNIAPDQIAFIGDDINDLDCIKWCRYSACPADAHEEVQAYAQIVLDNMGGYGAFREFADMILNEF
jgi:YrbI family 3-deoxy-D-manno-octulosonate 8-phosphate phosphatase